MIKYESTRGSKNTLNAAAAVIQGIAEDKGLYVPDHIPALPFEIKEPLLSPLYLLPFFQILAFRITTDLNKWHRHPMFKDFEKLVSCKTEKIKEIMPNS